MSPLLLTRLPFAPEAASTVAGRVDALYIFLIAVAGFFSVLIAVLELAFAVKYRRRAPDEVPRPIAGSIKLESVWIVIPFILSMGIFAWGASLYFTIMRPPQDALDVYVVGKQWMWRFQHPGGQREINTLHVPVGRKIKLTMATEDVIHSLFVPAFRVKMDVVPGRYTTLWFEATKTGTYHLFCAEYCGTQHSGMVGSVVVMGPAEYQAWLGGGGPQGSLAGLGEKLFRDLACHTCHRRDVPGRGPNLEGVFGKPVRLRGGQSVIADENYLRESILHPGAKLVAGFQNLMPTFQGQVSEEQLMQLIAYLRSIGGPPGATGPSPAAGPSPGPVPPGRPSSVR